MLPIHAARPMAAQLRTQQVAAQQLSNDVAPAALQIGVLGRHDDPSVHNIAASLQARGAVAHLIDLSDVTHQGSVLSHKGGTMPAMDAAIAYHGAELPTDGMHHMRLMEQQGLAFVNDPDSITYSRDKWLSGDVMQWGGVRTPTTRLAHTGDEARALTPEVSPDGAPTILKLRVGTEGKGVMKVSEPKEIPPIVEAFGVVHGDGVVLQRMVPMQTPADIRAFTVNGKVVASMERKVGESKDGDFRTNLSNGGTAEPIELHPRDRETAERAVAALGLDVSGVDLMGDRGRMYVIEANSGPGQKIKDITGVPVDDHIARLAIDRAREVRAAAQQVQ